MNKKIIWGIIAGVLAIGGTYVLINKQAIFAPDQLMDLNQPGFVNDTGIVIEQPLINQEVQLPITVKGYINGNGWNAFEGVAGSVQVLDANGKAITEKTPLQATTDWMQSVVHFETTIGDANMMNNLATQTGILVFKNENTKGDPANDNEFRVAIKFIK